MGCRRCRRCGAGGRSIRRVAARDGATGQGMAGGPLARAGRGACPGIRAGAAVGHRRRALAGARHYIWHCAFPRAQRRPLDEVARLIAGAAFVVGVDTGLMHSRRAWCAVGCDLHQQRTRIDLQRLGREKACQPQHLVVSIYGGVESCGAVIATTAGRYCVCEGRQKSVRDRRRCCWPGNPARRDRATPCSCRSGWHR